MRLDPTSSLCHAQPRIVGIIRCAHTQSVGAALCAKVLPTEGPRPSQFGANGGKANNTGRSHTLRAALCVFARYRPFFGTVLPNSALPLCLAPLVSFLVDIRFMKFTKWCTAAIATWREQNVIKKCAFGPIPTHSLPCAATIHSEQGFMTA